MAEEVDLVCANHPKRATRLRCSACDRPICLKCMRESSVGIKCPSCARPPLRARMVGRPRHYVAGAGAGLVVAGAAAALLMQLRIGLFGLLGPALIGYVSGSVVVRAASNLRHPGIQGAAAASTAIGLAAGSLVAGFPVRGLATPTFMFSMAVAAGVAAFRAGR